MNMANDKSLRQHLLKLLKGGQAHVDFESAVKSLPFALRGKRPPGADHSPWELLEHMRIAQWDILEFARNPRHQSPEFPGGYWPRTPEPPNAKAWAKSVQSFRKDAQALAALVSDKSVDLFAKIPHGDGQTVLREILVAADHNAYHLGQLILVRRLLGVWK
jgi:hypothetical protein